MKSNKSQRAAKKQGGRKLIASLAHGFEVLEVLAAGGPEMNLVNIAQEVGRSTTTVWRLLHTLVDLGYVHQNPDTRRFAVAPRVLALGTSFEGMDLKELAGPFLRQLCARVGETVNMAVLDDDKQIYIERIKTTQIVNINLHVGSRLPLFNTSMGRALIAHVPQERVRELIARHTGDPQTCKYVQNGGRLLFEILEEVRRCGFAINDEDLAAGLRSVACPIWNNEHRVVAAVNIAVPSARVSVRELRTHYAPELIETAGEISAALGYRLPHRTADPIVRATGGRARSDQ